MVIYGHKTISMMLNNMQHSSKLEMNKILFLSFVWRHQFGSRS